MINKVVFNTFIKLYKTKYKRNFEKKSYVCTLSISSNKRISVLSNRKHLLRYKLHAMIVF